MVEYIKNIINLQGPTTSIWSTFTIYLYRELSKVEKQHGEHVEIDLATNNSHKYTQEKQREEKKLNHMNEEMNIGVYPSIE